MVAGVVLVEWHGLTAPLPLRDAPLTGFQQFAAYAREFHLMQFCYYKHLSADGISGCTDADDGVMRG